MVWRLRGRTSLITVGIFVITCVILECTFCFIVGGIKVAYRAYNRWAANNQEQKLPGLDFTPRQMFWVSSGQIWCGLYRKELMKSLIQSDSHSPNQLRVLGMVSNSKDFAADFNCSPKARMSPQKRCEMW